MKNTTIQEVYMNLLSDEKLKKLVNLENDIISIKLNDIYNLTISLNSEFEVKINEMLYGCVETEELYDMISELISEDFVIVQRFSKDKFYDYVLVSFDELPKYVPKWKKNFTLTVFNSKGLVNIQS